MGLIKSIFQRRNDGKKVAFLTKENFNESNFIIGDYTYGKPIILFNNSEVSLEIGKFCSIAENVTIFLGGNHRTDWITTYPFNDLPSMFPESSHIKGHPATKGNVIIENDVWIGRNVTILSGITIANGAVIGTESVVTKNIGPYEIWAGNPARFIKKRFSDEEIKALLNIKWWDWEIDMIRKKNTLLCNSDIESLIKS